MVHGCECFANLFDLLDCLIRATDLIDSSVSYHQQQVAFIAGSIADKLELPAAEKQTLVVAALMHDIGAFALKDTLDFIEEEPLTINHHAFIGARLFSVLPILENVSKVIKFHHIPWANGKGNTYRGEAVPLLSHIVHLSDRIAIRISHYRNILSQTKSIKDYVLSKSGTDFVPEYVDAFMEISNKEAFWLDLINTTNISNISEALTQEKINLSLDECISLTKVFSQVIDFRSKFTAVHSAGVAATAVRLAELFRLSEYECKMMHIAGNLHDIGKLTIPKEILEKGDKLDPIEYDIIKTHSYYTYKLLEPIKNFEVITHWAAYHHERINGKGYPFHISGEGLSIGARIMAVADTFTAIIEDRPYRKGMSKNQIVSILRNMAENESLSQDVVDILIEKYDDIAAVRKEASDKAAVEYGKIMSISQND